MATDSHAITFEDLQTVLPEQIMSWSKDGDDRTFTPQTLFDYINGGAEVYRAYHMRGCFSRRYAAGQEPAISLDIFDMGTSADAFGVFTHDRAGKAIRLGQDGRLRPGWINFWKDRFFISIYAEEETPATQKAVRLLGEKVDSLIKAHGTRPKIIRWLPGEGLQANSIRYFHHHVILNYHYYLSDENLLSLSPETEAVLAGYQRKNGNALILLVSYPKAPAASNAFQNFKRYYLEEGGDRRTALVLIENNQWSACRISGRLLVIVLEADSRQLAEDLLNTVKTNDHK
jgi:hypothetical protein